MNSLKALNELKKRYGINFSCQDDQRARTIEKSLKALEIIKNKRVDVELLMKVTSAKDYNKYSKNTNPSHNLGDREFDLLKEVLQ